MEIITNCYADEILEEIRELEKENEEMIKLANDRIDRIKASLEDKLAFGRQEIEFKTAQLRAYFLNNEHKAKETKILKTISLLSGKLVMKKESKTFDCDKETLKTSNLVDEYIKAKVIKELDWTSLKKDLIIDGDNIVNTKTGEIMECDGLSIKVVPSSINIKF